MLRLRDFFTLLFLSWRVGWKSLLPERMARQSPQNVRLLELSPRGKRPRKE